MRLKKRHRASWLKCSPDPSNAAHQRKKAVKITRLHSVVSTVSVFYKQQLLARTFNTCMQPPWQGEGNSNKLALIFVSFFPHHVIQSLFFLSKILLYFVLKLTEFSLKLTGNKEHRLFPFSRKFTVVFSKDGLVFTCNASNNTSVHAHTHIVDESV